jgi:hypothetical protein
LDNLTKLGSTALGIVGVDPRTDTSKINAIPVLTTIWEWSTDPTHRSSMRGVYARAPLIVKTAVKLLRPILKPHLWERQVSDNRLSHPRT